VGGMPPDGVRSLCAQFLLEFLCWYDPMRFAIRAVLVGVLVTTVIDANTGASLFLTAATEHLKITRLTRGWITRFAP
jgi:hypothetical protein